MQHLRNSDALAKAVMAALEETPLPSVDVGRVRALLAQCPQVGETPLREVPGLAKAAGVGQVHLKDERGRMGLGSFKALGAAYVIARDAEAGKAAGQTYITASAGNHGLSVAAGAAAFGARAVIYLAETVPEGFAERLRALGAQVIRAGTCYEDSMAAAGRAAEAGEGALLSDSSWPGYHTRPRTLMEGYLVLMEEAVRQMPEPPTHLFLQAGVGGLAAACAAYARHAWGREPRVVVVEPEAATALLSSMKAGAPQVAPGPVSAMGRLDCKEPSVIALKGLARDADDFIAISEEAGAAGQAACAAAGLDSTPSGSAGVAGMLAAAAEPEGTPGRLGLNTTARVLVILSEAAEG